MKFTAIFAAVASATLVSAQGYNNTHGNTTKPYDARTVSVPVPTHPPTTALTSIYTITSKCGSVSVFLPSTRVFPISGYASGTVSRSAQTYSGTGTPSSTTGGATIPTAAAGMGIAGVAGLVAAIVL